MPKHRIKLVQFVHAPRDLFDWHAELAGQFILLRVVVRQKFMQRRIEKTNGCGQSIQGDENTDEIFALIGQ